MSAKIVILGNGPSLKGFDFQRLGGVDTLGMNAAYRYWDRINWYPDHYCCLDPELIQTHWRAIRRLVEEGQVKSAFLLGSFLDFYPEAAADKRFIFLDQFVYHWFLESGREYGFEYQYAPVFASDTPEKLTTGAYAVRYALYLGYTAVGLLGIDLKYVEMIAGARQGEGIQLEMIETPPDNPNYFFADYQQKGDKFQIPNPDYHDHDLHPAAFVALGEDLIRQQIQATVINCNKNSELHRQGIFPYQNIGKFLGESELYALVLMTQVFELQQILDLLSLWQCPKFIPFTHLNQRRVPRLIISVTGEVQLAFESALQHAFEQSPLLQANFSSLECRFIEIATEDDVYIRDFSLEPGPKGYKSGPNQQFFQTIESLNNTWGYCYFVETDCAPIRPDWLGYINDLIKRSDKFWVLGGNYAGESQLSWRYARHINGSAIYATGDPEFQAFMYQWQQINNQMVSEEDPKLAYDCVLEYFISQDPMKNQRMHIQRKGEPSTGWLLFQRLVNRFKYSEFILNLSGRKDDDIASSEGLEKIRAEKESTVLVHNRKLVEMLVAQNSNKVMTEISTEPTLNYPRLLIIDVYPLAYHSATGQVKAMFFSNWGDDCVQQLCISPVHHSPCIYTGRRYNEALVGERADELEIVRQITLFAPELIYFRPSDSPVIFKLATLALEALPDTPLVVHMMDDWPARLENSDPDCYQEINPVLIKMIHRAEACWSISEKMSQAYYRRYGCLWLPIANAVNSAEYRHKLAPRPQSDEFVIRYQGALAEDMGYNSVREVAQAVSRLRSSHKIRLEIYTMKWCWKRAEVLAELDGISIHQLLDNSSYIHSLRTADALLITYNFDPDSIRYTRYSMANKLPECLASATPVLAYGPPAVATIAYLQRAGCARVVDRQDNDFLKTTLVDMMAHPGRCEALGVQAQKYVEKHLDRRTLQARIIQLCSALVENNPADQIPLLGPYKRADAVHLDETKVISRLFHGNTTGHMMIDVGAHHGGALAPFVKKGWQVYAFEPDQSNRAILQGWVNKESCQQQVQIDPRCISDKIESNLAFFTSAQSHGISTLNAFHDSHEETQRVDSITLADYFQDIPLHRLQFLKIDTEGYDLFVLRGYPWERFQPAVIECEFEDSKTLPLGYSFHDLANFLLNKGYVVYVSIWHPVIRYGIQHNWLGLSRYPCALPSSDAWGNILAFRQPPVEKQLLNAFMPSINPRRAGPANTLNDPAGTSMLASQHSGEVKVLDAGALSALPAMLDVEKNEAGQCYCWSGENPEITIELELERSRPLKLQLELFAIIKGEYLRQIRILENDNPLEVKLGYASGKHSLLADIPPGSKKLTYLKFVLPATHTPLETGISEDKRRLGMAIHQLIVTPVVNN